MITGTSIKDHITGTVDDDTINGGAGNDTIAGDDGVDTLYGNDDNDTLIGGDLGDILYGGDDDDVLDGGNGNDAHYGGAGNDTLLANLDTASFYGGIGNDWVDIGGSLTSGAAFDIDLGAGNDSFGNTYAGIENVRGGSENDTITGDGMANTLLGEGGNDTVEGDGRADSIDGGAGNDDIADYSGSSARVTVFLNGAAGISGDAQGDTLTNIEHLIGTNANDFLGGTTGSNSLSGGDSQDILDGQDGGVTDTLNGGDGIDTAYYFGATGNQKLDLSDHTNLANNQGEHTNDTWISIEGFFGANGFTNDLTGDNVANYLLGGSLGDTISGLDGADHLYGLAGNDTLIGGNGNDILLAGAGTDTVTGGADLDIFYILTGNGIDIVTDWNETDDFFFFYQIAGVGSYSDLTFTDLGTDMRITSANNATFEIIVQNRELTDLDDTTHFVFG